MPNVKYIISVDATSGVASMRQFSSQAQASGQAAASAIGNTGAQAAQAVTNAAQVTSTAVGNMGQQIQNQLKNVKITIGQVAASIQDLGMRMSLAITLPLAALAKEALQVAGNMEVVKVSLESITKSGSAALLFFNQVKELALSTPFSFPAALEGAKRLVAYGFAAKDAAGMLRLFGDTAFALAGSAEGTGTLLERIILAFGQIQAKGKVMSQEMRQLAEANIRAWDILAAGLGVTVAKAMDMVSKGLVESSKAIPILLAGLQDQFGGLMGKAMDKLPGQVALLKNQLYFLASSIGNNLLPVTKVLLEKILIPMTKAINDLAVAFSKLPYYVKGWTLEFFAVLAISGPLLIVLGFLAKAILDIHLALIALSEISLVQAILGGLTFGVVTAGLVAIGAALAFIYRVAGPYIYAQKAAAESAEQLSNIAAKAAVVLKDKFGVVIEQGTKSLKDWKEQVIGMLAYLSNTVQGDWLSFAKRLKNIAPGDVELTDEQVRELRRNKELQDKLLDAKKDFFNVEGKIQSDYLEGEAAINAEYANKNIALIIDSLRERKEALEQINKTGVHHDVETPENKALALQILHTKQLTNETERLGAIAQLNDKLAKQGLKDRLEVADKLYNFQQELNSKEKAYLDKIASSQVDQIDRIKDARINALEAENAQGLAAKIHLESLKAAIEIDAIKKTSAIKAAAIQEDTRIEIEAIIAKAETLDQLNAAQATAIKIQGLANQLAMENAKKTADGIFKIQTSAVHKQVQLAEEQYTKIFNSLKTQAGGVFDALLTKASSVWAAIGNALKVAVLTAIKDIVTSRVAALLMKLFTGVNVTLKGKADVPGIFGKLGGILGVGAEPEFHFTTKLDEVNHLGDAVLINGALPVVLTSPMGGSPIDVGGGANLSSMVGGLAMGLGAIRGGGSAISSTIDYGAGAIPVTSTMSGGGVMPLPSPIGSTLSGAATNLATVAPVLAAISGQKGGGLGAVLSGAKMVGMLAGGLHGLKALIGIGGSTGVGTSIQIGAGQATTWGAATLGQKLGALGKSDAAALAGGILALNGWGRVGATKSGASNIVGTAELAGGGALVGYKYASAMGMTGLQGGLLGGGIGLTVAGLKKGGWTGVGMDVVGGAMAGFALGGPIGAAIGAAVGGVAGLVRMLFKGATQKVREKIKQIYKIDITSQGVLQQIVDIAKSAYGGNLNMAVRSTQVAELVKLYALTTDQNPSGLPLMMQASTLVQQNGLLFRQPETLGGRALNSLGGTIPVGTPSPVGAGAGGGAIILRLDGPATTDLLNGVAVQAIADNPRTVQGAVTQANLSSAGRRENTSLMFQPGLLTS